MFYIMYVFGLFLVDVLLLLNISNKNKRVKLFEIMRKMLNFFVDYIYGIGTREGVLGVRVRLFYRFIGFCY